jgi:siroheme synthase (precorrin-2 oxidase/ferrochelatase)
MCHRIRNRRNKMQNCSSQEILGLFEALDDNEDKIDTHKETIKMIKADSTEQLKTFSQEKEVSVTDLKDAYKYYRKRVKDGEAVNEDYFTLCAMIDAATEDEEEENQ